jgi:hypothetical protein
MSKRPLKNLQIQNESTILQEEDKYSHAVGQRILFTLESCCQKILDSLQDNFNRVVILRVAQPDPDPKFVAAAGSRIQNYILESGAGADLTLSEMSEMEC